MNSESTNSDSTQETRRQTVSPRINYLRLFGCLGLLLALATFAFWFICLRMPGQSAANSTGPGTSRISQQSVSQQLQAYVDHLSVKIGERNLHRYDSLCETATYLEQELKSFGYKTSLQVFQVNNLDCTNIVAEISGKDPDDEIVIVGAHYDTALGTPGANDNGSGVASMLVLARRLKEFKPDKTLRFVAFTNEEPPYFQNRGQMGSWVYAEDCRKSGEKIVAVLSLETMGYFSDEENSQKYPAPLNAFYPSTGNFIGFVSNVGSGQLQRRVIKSFREHSEVPSEGASLPAAVPGVGWSDHWSFWQEGYPGIMVTDTAPFRYPHYHQPTDTSDKLDYEKLAMVTESLQYVVKDLCSADE